MLLILKITNYITNYKKKSFFNKDFSGKGVVQVAFFLAS